MSFSEIAKGIFRLKVPFEDLYTAVFFVRHGNSVSVIDCATTPYDVDTYILPALQSMEGETKELLLTHSHGDHAGGAERLLERCPTMRVRTLEKLSLPSFCNLYDGEIVSERLQVIHLPGHTRFSVGYLDLPTRTLITGDCLQLAGVGKYTRGIGYPELYLQSIEKIRRMDVDRIVASHDYVPLGSIAEGKEAITRYLDMCERICLQTQSDDEPS